MLKGLGSKGWQRARRVLPGLMLAWLVACGGGSGQIEPFKPRQIIFVGDETVGLLPSGGRRIGINFINTDNNFDCAQLPIWSQQLASSFGFASDNCNSPGAPGVTRAFDKAKVADLEGQISAQAAASGITSKDLFVVTVGMNDIIELYEQFPAHSEAELTAELSARGTAVASQVNRIVGAGGRVLLSTVHDLSVTPYAIAQRASNNDTDRAALISRLTQAFNARVRVDILQDGRFIGLVLADDDTQAIVRSPGSFGLGNVTDPACAVAPPACDTTTLVSGATSGTHLWADDRHFGPVMHNQIASQAITRARNNPF
jgi:hypothetical protein